MHRSERIQQLLNYALEVVTESKIKNAESSRQCAVALPSN